MLSVVSQKKKCETDISPILVMLGDFKEYRKFYFIQRRLMSRNKQRL